VLTADSPEVLARFHGELDLVEIIANQVAHSIGSHVQRDDLVSAGREGLPAQHCSTEHFHPGPTA